jgi:CheY-like chemotaxis protein
VPIYALVRQTDSSDIQKCLDAGADACLSKPIVQDAVFDVLEKARTAKNLREVHGHVVDMDAAGHCAPEARRAGENVPASTPHA